MAQHDKSGADYGSVVKAIAKNGPSRLYLVYGREDYLRDRLAADIKTAVLGAEGDDAFSYRRIDGPLCDSSAAQDAVASPPFLTERSLVELRGIELNAVKDADAARLKAIFSDIPEYCTVLITLPTGCEPDGRLSLFKAIKKYGEVIEFTRQGQSALITWLTKRVYAAGISISRAACEKLIFMTGGLMSRMAPECEKLIAYKKSSLSDMPAGEADAAGNAEAISDCAITDTDVAEICVNFPEATVFELTEQLSSKNWQKAADTLSDLFFQRVEPIMILAMLARNTRQLYTAKLIISGGGGARELMDEMNIKFDFIAKRLIANARGFEQGALSSLLARLARMDFELKDSRSSQGEKLLTELIIELALGDAA